MKHAIILLALCLPGCAATWYHPDYTSQTSASRHFAIDNGRCQQVAAGAAPMPIPSTSNGSRRAYTSGEIYDSRGRSAGRYSSTTQSYTTQNAASGFASGLNIGNSLAASGARNDIYRGCMTQMGWTTDKERLR